MVRSAAPRRRSAGPNPREELLRDDVFETIIDHLEDRFDSHDFIFEMMRRFPREYTSSLYECRRSKDPIQTLHAKIGRKLLEFGDRIRKIAAHILAERPRAPLRATSTGKRSPTKSRTEGVPAPMERRLTAYPRVPRLARSGELAGDATRRGASSSAARLCPRRCGVNRLEDERGVCRIGRRAIVFERSRPTSARRAARRGSRLGHDLLLAAAT